MTAPRAEADVAQARFDAPIDALDAAVIAIGQLYREIRADEERGAAPDLDRRRPRRATGTAVRRLRPYLKDLAMQGRMLSAHVAQAKFEFSATAAALAIDNRMPSGAVLPASWLCQLVLEPIRAHFGVPIVINSGYRCLALNRRLGSKDDSQHLRGEAADIELPAGPDNAALAAWIAGSGLPFDQLILESYHPGHPRSGWVHVSHAAAGRQRGSILTMTMGSHGAVYAKGLHP